MQRESSIDDAIVERVRAGGYHTMVGLLDATNTASIRLHEAAGFRAAGTLPQVGFKFGRSLGTVYLQKHLTPKKKESFFSRLRSR